MSYSLNSLAIVHMVRGSALTASLIARRAFVDSFFGNHGNAIGVSRIHSGGS